jgi:tetratricopeptide (TPR) repeat protein
MSADDRHWESSDYSVSKVVLRRGDGSADRARFGATATVRIHEIISCSEGFDIKNDLSVSKYLHTSYSGEFQIGDADTNLDRVLERCVSAMEQGEECDAALRVPLEVKKNCMAVESESESVWIHVELRLSLEKLLNATPIYQWFPETKLDKARDLSAGAVRLFKAHRHADAFHKFRMALTLLTFALDDAKNLSEELAAEAEDLRMACYSNLAACHFQWNNHDFVIDLTTKVLEKQTGNVKLLYRRGVSYMLTKDFESARPDLVEAHRLDPSNKAINEKLGQLRVLEMKHRDQLASGLKKMFA